MTTQYDTLHVPSLQLYWRSGLFIQIVSLATLGGQEPSWKFGDFTSKHTKWEQTCSWIQHPPAANFITEFERCKLAIGVAIDASAWVANSGFGQDPLQSFKRLHFHGHHLATQAHWIIALPHPLSLAIIDRFLWGLDHPNVQLHLCYPTIWLIHAIRHLW